RSRFTCCSWCSEPRVVTRAVSGPTSKCTSCPSTKATVRQTPLTATLSPAVNSEARGVRRRSRYPETICFNPLPCPTDSLRPVNITFDQHIGAERLDATFDQRHRREAASLQERNALGTDPHRRHVELDVVDEPFVPQRRVHVRPALDDQALHAARGQFAKCRA